MSLIANTADWISPEDYLEGERLSEIRHEYVYGRVFAMAGASDDHNRIAGNLFAVLHGGLRGKACEAFVHDMKVRVNREVFYYPDVVVVCDHSDAAKYYRERPSVIFEVISPETERTDRREKAFAYREIPTVQSYVILEQERIAVTVLRRAEVGWASQKFEGAGAVFELPEIDMEIPLAQVYERTSAAGQAV